MWGRASEFNKTTVLLIGGGLIASVVWYFLGLGSWTTNLGIIGSQILIAFLAVVSIVQIHYHSREEFSSHSLALFISVLFIAGVRIASVVLRMTLPSDITVQQSYAEDTLEFLIVGIVIFAGVKYNPVGIDHDKGLVFGVLVSLLCMAVYALFYFLVIPAVEFSAWIMLAFIMSTVSLVCFFQSVRLVIRNRNSFKDVSTPNIITAYVLFAIATIPLCLDSLMPADVIGLTIAMFAVSLFFLNSSLLRPFDNRGVEKKTVLGTNMFLLLVPSSAFVIAELVISWFPRYQYIDVGMFRVLHFSVGLIAAVMAMLLIYNSWTKSSRILYLVSLLFITWSITELFIAFILDTDILSIYGQSLSSEVIASIFSLIILAQIIRDVLSNADSIPTSKVWPFMGVYIVLFTLCLFIGEIVQVSFFSPVEQLVDNRIGEILTVILDLFAMAEITYLSSLLFERNRYRLSIDLIGICSLSFWIVPAILKALFEDWTIGFWAAEIFLLSAIALSPALLGILYTNSLVRETNWREEADLYSDLLMHDISNYLQALLVSVELVEDSHTEDIFKESALRSAVEVIRRAETLILNVRRLSETREIVFKELKPINLIEVVNLAFKSAVLNSPYENVSFIIRESNWAANVLADESLVFVFANLFQNAIMYSEEDKRIEVATNRQMIDGRGFIVTKVIDYGKGISPRQRETILNTFGVKGARIGLGLAVAKRLVASYGGRIQIKSRVEKDYKQGTVVEVMLLDAETETQHSSK